MKHTGDMGDVTYRSLERRHNATDGAQRRPIRTLNTPSTASKVRPLTAERPKPPQDIPIKASDATIVVCIYVLYPISLRFRKTISLLLE